MGEGRRGLVRIVPRRCRIERTSSSASRWSLCPAWLALGLLLVAPFLSGAKPPWIWGFLLAALALLSASLLICEGITRTSTGLLSRLFRGSLGWLHLPLAGLVLWTTVHWLVSAWSLPAGPFGSPSMVGLAFVWAFAAAWLLGARLGLRVRHLRICILAIWLSGVLCALWSLLAWSFRWPPEYYHWPLDLHRPSGPFVNANRFAVHLSMGLFCGLALLALRWRILRGHRQGWRSGLLLAGCALIFVALCLTLSRLTILAVGLAVGFGGALWLVRRLSRIPLRRRAATVSRAGRSPFVRVGRILILTVLLGVTAVVFLGLAHMVGRRELAERYELVSAEVDPDVVGRRRVMTLGVGLFLEKPVGRGLGGFENAFRQVQPADSTGRWQEAHNDWLQVAIELGVPGILLLGLAFAGWSFLWWSSLRRTRRGFHFYLSLPLGLGLLVPVFCSLADFPLREPATGLLFFCLAGAHAGWMSRGFANAQGGRAAAWRALELVLVLPMLVFALWAVRIGWATSQSPWCGWVYPPPPGPAAIPGYRLASEGAPAFKPLLIQYGLSLTGTVMEGSGSSPESDELARVADRIQALDPDDYLAPLLRARVLQASQAWVQAAWEAEQAVRLAPACREVRLLAIGVLLHAAYNEKDRDRFGKWVERIRVHMRYLLAVQPEREGRFTEQLRNLGLRPEEVAELWPRHDPASRLPRARYWAQQRDWYRLEDELARFGEQERQTSWFHAWQGRSHFMYGELTRGMESWQKAVADHRLGTKDLRRWLGEEAKQLPPALVERWVEHAQKDIATDPDLSIQLAYWLDGKGRTLRAERLMLLAMATPRADILRCASALSVRLGDLPEALNRAKQAYAFSDQSPPWKTWLAEMEKRCAQKK